MGVVNQLTGGRGSDPMMAQMDGRMSAANSMAQMGGGGGDPLSGIRSAQSLEEMAYAVAQVPELVMLIMQIMQSQQQQLPQ